MPFDNPNSLEAPILILALTGNDARNAASVLERVKIRSRICANMAELCAGIGENAGGLIVSEEALQADELNSLLTALTAQPPWSDIPLILVTADGEIRQRTYNILNHLGTVANITLLEKPLRIITLISVAQTSLRSRSRQLEVRDLLRGYAEAAARTEFLSRLTAKLSSVHDGAEMNVLATREIGEFLKADRCYFFQGSRQIRQVKVLPDWRRDDGPSMQGLYDITQMGRTDWLRALQAETVAISDVREDAWTKENLAAYEDLGVRSYMMVPFVHEGHWTACICVASKGPRQWTTEERAFLEGALARVWPLIERARAETALREVNGLLADKAAHLESLVQLRTAKLTETITDLEAFSYSIAHDMRAPLRSLQGFSEILLEDYKGSVNKEGQHLLQRIAAAASRMDKLIRDVLNYSRVMRADFPLRPVALGPLLETLVKETPNLGPEIADIALEGPFPTVMGNEAMLIQIFSNLMGNAIKFMPAGIKPRLRLWAEPREGFVRVSVEDNGIGISSDQHEKIFGIFQQVSRDYDGTGIGLAITKKAVERMAGRVGLRSELGQGSTFWIEVQAVPQDGV